MEFNILFLLIYQTNIVYRDQGQYGSGRKAYEDIIFSHLFHRQGLFLFFVITILCVSLILIDK